MYFWAMSRPPSGYEVRSMMPLRAVERFDAANVSTNILLVDDNPSNLQVLRATLEDLGQNLVCAQSGAEALRHLLATDFALILMDVQMPEMDGFETVSIIR